MSKQSKRHMGAKIKSAEGVDAITVADDGKVGIGTDSPGSKLDVVASGETIRLTGIGGSTTNPSIRTDTSAHANGNVQNAFGAVAQASTQYGYVGTLSNHPLAFFANGTERMRIEASGNVLVGQSTFNTSNNGIKFDAGSTNAHIYVANTRTDALGPCMYLNREGGSGRIVEFRQGGIAVGHISVTSTATSFNQSASDYRLKEAIAPLEGGLAKVCAMKPVSFKWKESGKSDIGFIAHELQAVIPEAISGEKDAVDAEGNPEYQAIFPAPAQMVASLVAAIQELKAELDEAKAEIAALRKQP